MTIYITMGIYLIISMLNIFFQVKNEELSNSSFLRIGIGLIILYSLLNAKNWAKVFVTIACIISIAMLVIPTIYSVKNGYYSLAAINLILLALSVYIIRFLNVGEKYETYSELINKGFDSNKDELEDIKTIVSNDKLIDFDRKSFQDLEKYEQLAKTIFERHELSASLERIFTNQNSVFVETNETEYEIEISSKSTFFDNNFISGIDEILNDLNDDKLIAIVYPETTTNKRKYKLGCLHSEEYINLKSNGMVE